MKRIALLAALIAGPALASDQVVNQVPAQFTGCFKHLIIEELAVCGVMAQKLDGLFCAFFDGSGAAVASKEFDEFYSGFEFVGLDPKLPKSAVCWFPE